MMGGIGLDYVPEADWETSLWDIALDYFVEPYYDPFAVEVALMNLILGSRHHPYRCQCFE